MNKWIIIGTISLLVLIIGGYFFISNKDNSNLNYSNPSSSDSTSSSSTETSSLNNCEKIVDQTDKNWCFHNLAESNKDEKICEKIDTDLKRGCIIKVAQLKLDIKLCKVETFTGYNEQGISQEPNIYDYFCVTYIGQQTNDKNVCDIYLEDKTLKKEDSEYFSDACNSRLAWKLCDELLCDKLLAGDKDICKSDAKTTFC